MKCFAILFLVGYFAIAKSVQTTENVADSDLKAQASEQQTAASSFYPFQDKRQEKRYVGGYGAGYGGYSGGYGGGYGAGYGGYGGGYGNYGGYGGGLDYSSRVLGLDSGSVYNPAYGSGYGGYSNNGYGSYLGGYNPYGSSYYSSRLGGYPYNSRTGYGGIGGYNSYPSSYYSSNYANSVVGGGLGGLGTPGIVPPVGGALGAGYQYGPGISGTIY